MQLPILCKIPIFGLIEAAQSDAAISELIGPVLVAAARIFDDIKTVSEKQITGSEGNGPIDYGLVYKDFNIVISEEKKDDITKGLGQNVAQLAAGREDYLVKKGQCITNKKRSFDEYQPSIADIDSCGIVSTAGRWIFTRYSRSGTRPVFYCSNAFEIPLGNFAIKEYVMKGMTAVVRILVEILRTLKLAVDGNAFAASL